MYLIDTNVIGEGRRHRAEPRVREWLNSKPTASLFTSVIVAAEIESGVLAMERRDPAQGAVLRHWMAEQFLPAFADRILPVDLAVALKMAEFHVPDPAPQHDALIGATAAVHGLTVVTRNVRDFERFGIPIVNPWEVVQ